jgi:hypothetical protein
MLQPLQQDLGSGAIVDVGWMHAVLQQIALRINEKMALAALVFLPPSYPRGPPISEVLTDWLSMIAAVGCGVRPIVRR